jgi:hypothetical protein
MVNVVDAQIGRIHSNQGNLIHVEVLSIDQFHQSPMFNREDETEIIS